MHHFGLTFEEVQQLDDDTFCEVASLAYFYEDRWVLAVQRGLILALKEICGK